MKTEQETMQMVDTCDVYHSCALCPYNPEDLSRYIGDKWKGGCPNCDRKLVYAMGKGYGDVSEYKAEIERLSNENCELTKRLGARFTCDFVRTAQKHAQIDVLNKVKEKLDSAPNGWAYTTYIDELIEEVQNE